MFSCPIRTKITRVFLLDNITCYVFLSNQNGAQQSVLNEAAANALYIACQNGFMDGVDILMKDVDQQKLDGWASLHIATARGE